MILERNNTPGARFLLMGACLVVVIAGLRMGASVLLPFAFALFLSVLSMPLMLKLQSLRIPASLSILITIMVIGAIFSGIILLATQSVADLQSQLPSYQFRLRTLYDSWISGLSDRAGVPLKQYLNLGLIDPGAALGLFGQTAARVVGFLGNTFLVLLVMVFILAEATVFPLKLRAIRGTEDVSKSRMTKIVKEIQEYLAIKTVVSLTTGLLIGIVAWRLKLDFPVLLGIIGFVMNYIPTVGSILAAIPAVVLSLVQFGTLGHFVAVSVSYGLINTVLGNIIEPNLMGRRLGLSTLVVVLSLLFWAWLWGPVGALLAIPLTMMVRIMLENTEDLRWMAILLDKSPVKFSNHNTSDISSDLDSSENT
jgi:AI-2 transport protein TqsA